MDISQKYFPGLTQEQIDRFARLGPLYEEWNQRINLISRKDIDSLYEKHILHSMAIGKFIRFTAGSSILDVGTGGGFPGIPLAILFPEARFHLVDSIGKKIRVVQAIKEALELSNVRTEQIRAELLKEKYDFVISRAVTGLPEFMKWVTKNVSPVQKNAIPNGILYLKGGDLGDEIRPFKNRTSVFHLSDYFTEPFFETKKLLFIAV